MGDEHAWLARTYDELKHELFTVCVHLVGERAAAEDLLHDVFLAFARGAADRSKQLSTRADAKRYLVTSCIHRARDLCRRRPPSLATSGPTDDLVTTDGDPRAHAAAGDDSAQVRAALRELPDEQREVVTLHLHGSLKFREIAELLGLPLDTVTSRYRYALQKLRRRLTTKGVLE